MAKFQNWFDGTVAASSRIRITEACQCALFVICASASMAVNGQEVIPLWPNGAPGFEDRKDEAELAESYWVKNIHHPSITAFLPPADKATGAGVIICPGGGHRELVFKAEGVEAAEYLNRLGVAAFALKYRLGREEKSPYTVEKHAKQDGQRAMRLVRSRAEEWGLDPNRIGMMGFSAGGEVVSMVAYANGDGDANADDEVDKLNARPDFQIMIYPGPLGIPGQLDDSAPPAFLLVANDDGASRTIVDLISKFRAAGVPMEAHIYARGGHAFNMGNRSKLKTLSTWPDRLADWMTDNFILDATGKEAYEEKLKESRRLREAYRQRRLRQPAEGDTQSDKS